MKNCFYIKHDDGISLTILDLSEYNGIGMMIHRINVPTKFRGQGFARMVLADCLRAADDDHVNLYLEIHPSDGFDYNELNEWYSRNGFRPWKGLFRRKPMRT